MEFIEYAVPADEAVRTYEVAGKECERNEDDGGDR